MPLFGGNSGGVPISIPPYPVQPSRNEDSSSSSGSDSDSSSDSSSGSSSGSSDIAAGKVHVHVQGSLLHFVVRKHVYNTCTCALYLFMLF